MRKEKGYTLFNKDRIVYEYENNSLRIGADDDDIVQIRENQDVWKYLIELLDGATEVEAICKRMKERFGISEEQTKKYISQFEKRNLVEIFENKYEFNEKDCFFQSAMTYYSSRGLGGQMLLDKLQKMMVAVLGCGGGGSHIAFQIAQLGVGTIHLVDPDVVTVGNVNRQALFTMDDVDKKKVEVTKQMLAAKNPYVSITTSDKRLYTIEDVKSEILGYDWVFCAMDEPPYISQRIVNSACYTLKIPSVYGFSQKSAGKMFMVNPDETGCCDCLLKTCDNPVYRKFLSIYRNNEQELITANIYPNITLLCGWMTKKWIDVVSGKINDSWNKMLRFDFDRFEETVIMEFDKHENCPTCGKDFNENDEIWEILKIE